MAAGIAAAFSVGAINQTITQTIEASRQLQMWGQRLNVSTQEMYGWSAVAQQYGVDLDDIADGLQNIGVRANEALAGEKSQVEMWERVGVTLEQLRPIRSDNNALMELYANALQRTTDAGVQLFSVDEMLSDVGVRLLPVFRQGGEALNRQRREMERTGGAVVRLAERSERLRRLSRNMNRTWGEMRARLVERLLPALEELSEAGTKLMRIFMDDAEKGGNLTRVLIAIAVAAALVGVAFVASWAAAAAPVIATVGAVALLAAGMEDLIVWVDGGKSAFGEFLEALLGVERANTLLGWTQTYFENIENAIRETVAAISGFMGWASTQPGLNRIFGEETAQQRQQRRRYFEGGAAFQRGGRERARAMGRVGREAMGRAGEYVETIPGVPTTRAIVSGTISQAQDLRRRREARRAEHQAFLARRTAPRLELALKEQYDLPELFPPEAPMSMMPASMTTNTIDNRPVVNIIIDGAQDPEAIGNEVARRANEIATSQARSIQESIPESP
jgi:hypothetical protein